MEEQAMEVRPMGPDDRYWVAECCRRAFGSPLVVSLGRLFDPARLSGLVAWEAGRRAGVLAFAEESGGAGVVLVAADRPGRGAGTGLLRALEATAGERGWERLRLFTTNDNTGALRFYQRRGWDLAALHREAVDRDRELKPEIPVMGRDGIALRHTLELERRLGRREEGSA
jgi:ribosomal protein S18 acetylase RimI-like enzyme